MKKLISAFILTIFTSLCILPSPSLAAGHYILAAGDELEILILNKPELNTKQVIDPKGIISIPLITDRVHVAGMSISEFELYVKGELGKRIHNPDIVVHLTPRSIYVVQHFLKTDAIVYKQATTIEEAKAYAGEGYTKEIHYGDVIYVDVGTVPSWWDNNWVAVIGAIAVVVGIVINIKLSNR